MNENARGGREEEGRKGEQQRVGNEGESWECDMRGLSRMRRVEEDEREERGEIGCRKEKREVRVSELRWTTHKFAFFRPLANSLSHSD